MMSYWLVSYWKFSMFLWCNIYRDKDELAVCGLEFVIDFIQRWYMRQCSSFSYLKFSGHLCKSYAWISKVCSLEKLVLFCQRRFSPQILYLFKMQLNFLKQLALWMIWRSLLHLVCKIGFLWFLALCLYNLTLFLGGYRPPSLQITFGSKYWKDAPHGVHLSVP